MASIIKFYLFTSLFALLFNVVLSTHNYTIPIPDFRVYYPRGFDVSIPDEDGIERFIFHGNINQRLKAEDEDYKIEHRKEASCANEDDRWMVKDGVARLRLGNKIYYRVYVKKNGEMYYLEDQMHIVKADDIKRRSYYHTERPIRNKFSSTTPSYLTMTNPTSECRYQPTSTTPAPKPPSLMSSPDAINLISINKDLEDCNANVFSLVQKISEMQADIDSITSINRILFSIANKYMGSQVLILSGKISGDDDPIQVVKFVMNEKLNIMPKIIRAVRNEDNSITFVVESLNVMLEILEEAEYKLSKSTAIKISF